MRTTLISVMLFISSLASHAEPFERYTKSRGLAPQVASTFHLSVDEDMNCTGFDIGRRGESLTNLHCLEKCLINAGVVSDRELGGITRHEVHLNEPVICSAEVMRYGHPTEKFNIEVLKVFGPGFLSPRENLPDFSSAQPELFASLLADGYEGFGDLALIRIPNANQVSCRSVVANAWRPDQMTPVYNLSYPLVFRRDKNANPISPGSGLMTMGNVLLWTQGEATQNVDQLSSSLLPEELKLIKTWMSPRTFLSSIDVEGGSSGSPVFNAEGDVIGIVRSTFNGNSGEYRAWTAEAIDLAPLVSEIQNLVPSNAGCSQLILSLSTDTTR